MLFQGGALFDSMTVLENVEFPLRMFSDMTAEERQDRAMECSAACSSKGRKTPRKSACRNHGPRPRHCWPAAIPLL